MFAAHAVSHEFSHAVRACENAADKAINAKPMLAQASPTPDRKEKRIFECAKGRFVETVTVPDPLQSDSMQWLAGELRPPE